MNTVHKLVNSIDVENLKHASDHAVGFPHFCIDDFLVIDFANEIEASFPDFNSAMNIGKGFNAHHEKGKVQVTEVAGLPEPLKKLNNIFCEPRVIELLEYVTGIEEMMKYPSRTTYGSPDIKLTYQWKCKYSERELRLVEGKIGELIAKSGYELSGLSPVTPSKYELLALAFRNKRYRILYNIRKYGIMLYFSRFLAERLGWQALLTSCKRKYSAIDIKGLK